jgi:hypothetical protein
MSTIQEKDPQGFAKFKKAIYGHIPASQIMVANNTQISLKE